jgi:hypothetical protein
VRAGIVAVTRNADAIEADGIRNLAQQIRREKDGPVDDRNDGNFFCTVSGGDVGSESFETALDRDLANKDGFEIFGLGGGWLRNGHRLGVKLSRLMRQQLLCEVRGLFF